MHRRLRSVHRTPYTQAFSAAAYDCGIATRTLQFWECWHAMSIGPKSISKENVYQDQSTILTERLLISYINHDNQMFCNNLVTFYVNNLMYPAFSSSLLSSLRAWPYTYTKRVWNLLCAITFIGISGEAISRTKCTSAGCPDLPACAMCDSSVVASPRVWGDLCGLNMRWNWAFWHRLRVGRRVQCQLLIEYFLVQTMHYVHFPGMPRGMPWWQFSIHISRSIK